MSRSYKKTPIIKSGNSIYRRQAKRFANKKVRKSNYIPNGKQYRKYYPQWDVCEYRNFGGTIQEALKNWNNESYYARRYKTKEEFLNKWKKWFYRK